MFDMGTSLFKGCHRNTYVLEDTICKFHDA